MHREPHPSVPPSSDQEAPGPSPARLRRVGLAAAVIAVLIAIAGIALRWSNDRSVAAWTHARAVPTVTVIAPQKGVSGVQTVLPGDIQAWFEAPIYARVSGYLQAWYKDFGAPVKKGDLLALIDAPDLDAELAAAEATLKAAEAQVKVREAEMEFARTTYERWRDSPKGVVSEQERESKKADFDTASARHNSALADVRSDQGAVDRLRALETFKRLVAPFDGIVTARNTDVGALINAGSGAGAGSAPLLFKVADLHEMRVFVRVPQELSARIFVGMPAKLQLPQFPDRTFVATVATTADAIDPASRTLLVELHAANTERQLQPGTYAEVHFELPAESTRLRIPASALIFREHGMQIAMLGKDNKVELRSVKLGRNLGTDVEVLAGLSMNDRVIDSPPDSLADGDHVQIAAGGPEEHAGAPEVAERSTTKP